MINYTSSHESYIILDIKTMDMKMLILVGIELAV